MLYFAAMGFNNILGIYSPRPVLPEPVETNIENNLVLPSLKVLANCVARNKAIWFVLFFE
jgi:hypothetical protein